MNVVASIDYFTVSGILPQTDAIYELLDPIMEQLAGEGESAQKLRRLQYEGYSVGPLAYFWGEDLGFIEASGEHAPILFDLAEGYDVRATRIDLQVTCWGEGIGPGIGRGALVAAGNHPGVQRSITHIEKPDGGETLYIGSPASNQRARLYRKDKLKRSPYTHDPTWRYEAMYRKPHAQKITMGLRNTTDDMRRQQAIAVTIAGFFADRGVKVAYPVPPGKAILSEPGRKISSLEAKLKWLQTSVRPSVRALIDAGLIEEMVHALGLLTPTLIEALKDLGEKR